MGRFASSSLVRFVFAFGAEVGQLGTGLLIPSSSTTPVRVVGIDTARFITAAPQGGNLGVCAVLASNQLSCWGAADFWMIGRNPSMATVGCTCYPNAAAPAILSDSNVATIGIADGTSVVAKTDKSVVAYGFPGYALKPVGSDPEQLTTVDGLPSTIVEIAAGARHACARTDANDVWCWGDAHLGSLGRSSFTGPDDCGGKACSVAAKIVPNVKGASRRGSERNVLAHRRSQHRRVGANQYGQLGHAAKLDVEPVAGILCAATPIAVEDLP